MKIGISTKDNKLESSLDERFGRAPGFIIYDLASETFSYIKNEQNLTAAQGAGIQAAQNLVNSGADALITGNVGPKAYQVLSAAGIEVYLAANMTVNESILKFKKGQLEKAAKNNVEGHWV
ncbi:MAG: dinitrogenase iron-molybdenum cofactor biosynthesis protein [Firmicutes bacterium HGW-Firmicutes-12]|jgi:predicted Fe-Mo cluster-binding NifX family protein|nr:MAG: dinitrogenase iron-molybdenum cofactor biosynthesis protein [Firmicutes bacterium HGW-Firmicutes-12]